MRYLISSSNHWLCECESQVKELPKKAQLIKREFAEVQPEGPGVATGGEKDVVGQTLFELFAKKFLKFFV